MSDTESVVQAWAIAATGLTLLGIALGAAVGFFRGFTAGLVTGLLCIAAPWAAAALRAATLGAGLLAYALGGFALVPAAIAAGILAQEADAVAPPVPRWVMGGATALIILSFAPAPLADALELGPAASAGWTMISVGGAAVVVGGVFAAARAAASLWVSFALVGVCVAYFGGLALQLR